MSKIVFDKNDWVESEEYNRLVAESTARMLQAHGVRGQTCNIKKLRSRIP